METDRQVLEALKDCKEELLERMYSDAENLFPLMDIRTRGGKKVSPYHLDGTKSSDGKGCIFNDGRWKYSVKDYAQGSKSILDLYLDREGMDFKTALFSLCQRYQIETPSSSQGGELAETYRRKQTLREWANNIFEEALWSPDGEEVLNYLRDRGWTDDEIKRAKLGYISEKTRKNLQESEKTQELKDELSSSIEVDGVKRTIGKDYSLSIPHFNGTSLEGWNFRSIDKTLSKFKYLHTSGEGSKNRLQGLRRNSSGDGLIVVEGDLDAFHAQLKGVYNIAATMGGEIRQAHIEDALKKGYKYFVLLFDNDERGQGFIDKSIENIERNGAKVYISSLPDGVKDTDEYLKNHSGDEWRGIVLQNSIPSCLRKLYRTLQKYSGKEVSYPERSLIIESFREIYRDTAPEDRELLKINISKYSGSLQIGQEDLEEMYSLAVLTLSEKSRSETISKVTEELSSLLKDGRVSDAAALLTKTSDELAKNRTSSKYSENHQKTTLSDEREKMGTIEEGLPTGIEFTGEDSRNILTIKEGLSLVCGAQGHRKTTFLLNVALNEAKRNIERAAATGEPLKKVLFYTYEMDSRRIKESLLNMYIDDKNSSNPLHDIEDFFRGKMSKGVKYNSVEEKTNSFFSKYIISRAIEIVYTDYNVGELLGDMKYFRSANEVSLVCIDYAQQIYSDGYTRQRTEEIKEVVNRIKNYAVSTSLPILMGAQFNRQIETPLDLKTQNIGEGGDFERIAVDIIGLYNLRKLDLGALYVQNTSKAQEAQGKTILGTDGARIKDLYGIKNSPKKEGIYKSIESAQNNGGVFLRDLLYIKLLKSRYGDYPLDTLLTIHDKTGKIELNREDLLRVETIQGELFSSPIPSSVTGGSLQEEIEDEKLPF